jgi:hypothetical protein
MHLVPSFSRLAQAAWPYFPRVRRVIPVAVGALLLLASGLKYYELATEPVAEFDLWTSRWFLVGLSDFELILGLWLLVGCWPNASRVVAITCFAILAQVALYKAVAGEISCGCFGKIPVDPWHTLFLDIAAMFALVGWCPVGRICLSDRDAPDTPSSDEAPQALLSDPDADPRSGNAGRPLLSFTAVALLFLLVGGTSFVLGTYQPATLAADRTLDDSAGIVLLEPEKWVGKPAPLLKYIDIGHELAIGSWLVVLYHHDCPKCQEAFPRYESAASNSTGIRVALIAVPPYGDGGSFPVPPDSPCRLGVLRPAKRWFVTTPAEIILKDAIVMPRTPDRVAYKE